LTSILRKLTLAAALLLPSMSAAGAIAQTAAGEAGSAPTAAAPTVAAPDTPAPNPTAEAFMDKLPATLGGTARLPGERKPGMPVMYFPKEMFKDPLVMAMAQPLDKAWSWQETREVVRGSFHETGIRQVLREGSFTVPDKPGARTFFGEYNTNMGLKQYWMFDHDGIRANLIVTIFRAGDRDKMRDEVADKVFGGARITNGQPAPEKQN
jgi:hypothetical protein